MTRNKRASARCACGAATRRASLEQLEPRLLMSADTPGAAVDIGNLSDAKVFQGAVSAADLNDYYRFSIAERSYLNLALTGLAADADVQLLDSGGRLAGSGTNRGNQSEAVFRAIDPGTYYVRVYSYSGSTRYSLSLAARPTAPQTPAPVADGDDQIREATSLSSIGGSRFAAGTIDVGTDVDIFSFNVTAGQQVAFNTDSNFDTCIRLFGADGVQLAFNDDGAAPGEGAGFDSYLVYSFSQAGRYYLGVSGYGNIGYNAVTGTGDRNGRTGAYALTVTGLTPFAGDWDDQIDEAVSLGPAIATGRTASDAIDTGTDVDMFSVDVEAGQSISFDVDSTFNTYLRLFSASGRELAANDNAAAPGEPGGGVDAYLQYTFGLAGRYYVAVSGGGNSRYNPITGGGDFVGRTGNYALKVLLVAPLVGGPPAGDTDDQVAEAVPLGAIAASRTVSDSISSLTDVDIFSVDVAAGQRISFDINGNFDNCVRLFDAGGRQLASNDNAPAPGELAGTDAYLAYTFAQAGRYYLGVSGKDNTAYDAVTGNGDRNGKTGNYTLVATSLADGVVKYHALVVGSGAYASARNAGLEQLAAQEAADVADALLGAAAPGQYAPVATLVNASVSRPAIENAIAEVAAAMDGDDVFVFYYGGQGGSGGLLLFSGETFTPAQLRQSLDRSIPQGARSMVVVNAGYSGAFVTDFQRAGAANTWVLSSATASQTTVYSWATGSPWAGSRFTRAFIDAMTNADSNGDGLLSAAETYQYVYSRMLAGGIGGTPQVYAAPGMADLPLLRTA